MRFRDLRLIHFASRRFGTSIGWNFILPLLSLLAKMDPANPHCLRQSPPNMVSMQRVGVKTSISQLGTRIPICMITSGSNADRCGQVTDFFSEQKVFTMSPPKLINWESNGPMAE